MLVILSDLGLLYNALLCPVFNPLHATRRIKTTGDRA